MLHANATRRRFISHKSLPRFDRARSYGLTRDTRTNYELDIGGVTHVPVRLLICIFRRKLMPRI